MSFAIVVIVGHPQILCFLSGCWIDETSCTPGEFILHPLFGACDVSHVCGTLTMNQAVIDWVDAGFTAR